MHVDNKKMNLVRKSVIKTVTMVFATLLEVNFCNLVAVGAVAAEDGLQARRGPALVIYEAACPEIPTSHHTTLILLPHSLQSSNSSNPSNNCVNAPTFVLLDI